MALDELGREQAAALAERLRPVQPVALVSSPLQRCVETARVIGNGMSAASAKPAALGTSATSGTSPLFVEDRLTECDYGTWTGRSISELRREKLWRAVQDHPSGVVFPGGESMRAVQARAVDAIRDHDRRLAGEFGAGAVWVAVSHGDVIKTVVADALGMHLDHFQRLMADPCSVAVISYTERRPFVVRLNDIGSDLAFLRTTKGRPRPSGDAVVGGGPGNRKPASGRPGSQRPVGG